MQKVSISSSSLDLTGSNLDDPTTVLNPTIIQPKQFSTRSDLDLDPSSVPFSFHFSVTRVVLNAHNRTAAPCDSRLGQNERLGDLAIRRYGNS